MEDSLFEWDKKKADANLRKHGIGFEEASSAYADPGMISYPDPVHSDAEDRWISVGMSHKGSLVTLVHTDRAEKIRLISARLSARKEISEYDRRTRS